MTSGEQRDSGVGSNSRELGAARASPRPCPRPLAAPKVLIGSPVGTIPVVTPESYFLNYRLAQELGLTVPEGMLNQAVDIIC